MFNLKLAALLGISSCVVFTGVNAAHVPVLGTPGTPRCVDVHVPKLGTYHGIRMESVNLTEPVNAWLGIDYVKQPVGDLRFRLPQPLDEFTGNLDKKIIDATQYGLICPQNKVSGREGDWANWPMGEACLNLNIYRPAGVSMRRKLPVAFYIHAVSNPRSSGSWHDLSYKHGLTSRPTGWFQSWCWPHVQWCLIRRLGPDTRHDRDHQLSCWGPRVPTQY